MSLAPVQRHFAALSELCFHRCGPLVCPGSAGFARSEVCWVAVLLRPFDSLVRQGFVLPKPVNKARQIMTKGALITIFQLQYVGCIKTFQRVATQILEPGPYSPAFCFLLTFQVFLVPKFSDQGFAFMGFFLISVRAPSKSLRFNRFRAICVLNQTLLVVMAFIAADFVVDQKTGELCEVPRYRA